MNVGRVRLAARESHGPWLVISLAASVILNAYLLLSKRNAYSLLSERMQQTQARRLADEACPSAGASLARMQDCASVACPSLYAPNLKVETGHSVYRPFLPDTRFRPTPPRDMLELTRLLYGRDSALGEPFIGYTNPYGRKADLAYEWTQINEHILEQTWALLGGRVRFFVEVGSFVGRSSILIANWLRRHDGRGDANNDAGNAEGKAAGKSVARRGGLHHQHAAVPLLCIDTWTGDLGMTLGAIYKEKIGRRHGIPTLYHTWVLNVLATNNTERILPLVAPLHPRRAAFHRRPRPRPHPTPPPSRSPGRAVAPWRARARPPTARRRRHLPRLGAREAGDLPRARGVLANRPPRRPLDGRRPQLVCEPPPTCSRSRL